MMTKPLLLAAAIGAVTLAISGTASAAPSVLGVTTPAGYIPMVKALNQVCEAPGVKIEGHFGGNTGQQIAQIEAGSGVSVVVTDAATLKSIKSKVTYTKTMTLGGTPMVLVWKKGLNLKGPEDLTDASVTRIAVADPKAAIYGRTAAQWLSGQKPEVKKALEPKWLAVRNLPQAMSYVVRGEADAAFVNVLAAKKNERKLGGPVSQLPRNPESEGGSEAVRCRERRLKRFLNKEEGAAILTPPLIFRTKGREKSRWSTFRVQR